MAHGGKARAHFEIGTCSIFVLIAYFCIAFRDRGLQWRDISDQTEDPQVATGRPETPFLDGQFAMLSQCVQDSCPRPSVSYTDGLDGRGPL
eukprot:8505938-Pyramimonas_sp.AAC.1